MTAINGTVTIKNELRPCVVDGKKALFHCWSQVSEIRDAILVGSVAGVISGTLGIVEFENGTVESCLPENIQFADGEFREYIFPLNVNSALKGEKMTNELKILPQYFQAVWEGAKTFEVRKNDRDFHVDDILVLKEWTGTEYTGSALCVKVAYMLDDSVAGIEQGYCVLGIKHL